MKICRKFLSLPLHSLFININIISSTAREQEQYFLARSHVFIVNDTRNSDRDAEESKFYGVRSNFANFHRVYVHLYWRLKGILVTRHTSFPGSWSFDPNPNSDRVPVTTTRTNKSRDNKIELGAKNPEGFSSRRTGLLEPGFDSHSESPSQEKP